MIQRKIDDIHPVVVEYLYMLYVGANSIYFAKPYNTNGYLVVSESYDNGYTYHHYYYGRVPHPTKRRIKKFVGQNDIVVFSEYLAQKYGYGELLSNYHMNVSFKKDTVEVTKGPYTCVDKADNLNVAVLRLALKLRTNSDFVIYPEYAESALKEFELISKEKKELYQCESS